MTLTLGKLEKQTPFGTWTVLVLVLVGDICLIWGFKVKDERQKLEK